MDFGINGFKANYGSNGFNGLIINFGVNGINEFKINYGINGFKIITLIHLFPKWHILSLNDKIICMYDIYNK